MVRASVNGKLIVATVHSDSLVSTISRLVNLSIEGASGGRAAENGIREMLGSGLAGVVFMSRLDAHRRAATEYLMGGPDVRAKISSGEFAGLQNVINMLKNRLSMNMPMEGSS